MANEPQTRIDADNAGPVHTSEGSSKTGVTEEQVIEVLRTIYDPEIPINIYDIGLIYGIDIDEYGFVDIRMTLTSPACPVAGTLPPEVEASVRDNVDGVTAARVEVVWDPPWSPAMMSDAAKLQLGLE